ALPGSEPAAPTAAPSTAIALAGYALLAGSGWRPPAFPALVVVGALAIDLLRARGGKCAQPLVLGFAFSGVFVIAELLRMTFFGPPAPTAVIGGTEQLSRLFFQYYAQAVARPWLSGWP